MRLVLGPVLASALLAQTPVPSPFPTAGSGGGGSTAFSSVTAGTNAAALVMGTGGSLTVSGSGTINATSLGGDASALIARLASPTFTGTVTIGDTSLTSTNQIIHTTGSTIADRFPRFAIFADDTSSAPFYHLNASTKAMDLELSGATYSDDSDLEDLNNALWLEGTGTTGGVVVLNFSAGPVRIGAGGKALANEFLRVNASGVIGIGPFPSLTTMDLGFKRTGAGALEVNNGTAGNLADIAVNSCTGCGGSPASPTGAIQFNSSGSFGASGLTYSESSLRTTYYGGGLNDMTTSGAYTDIANLNAYFSVFITSVFAGTDNFQWQKCTSDGTCGAVSANIDMTGAAQLLSDGVSVTFAAITGHGSDTYVIRTSNLDVNSLIEIPAANGNGTLTFYTPPGNTTGVSIEGDTGVTLSQTAAGAGANIWQFQASGGTIANPTPVIANQQIGAIYFASFQPVFGYSNGYDAQLSVSMDSGDTTKANMKFGPGGFTATISGVTGLFTTPGNLAVGGLSGAGDLPACLTMSGQLYSGSNTMGILTCP